MKIGILPCPGRCNVSMMTKTVAEFFVDDETIRVLPNLNSPLDDENGFEEKYISLNGCPSQCSLKEFEMAGVKPDEVITITKDFDPKNNEKYEVLLNIDEEVNLVQEGIDKLLSSKE